MSLRNWLRTRKRLVFEADYYRARLLQLYNIIDISESIEEVSARLGGAEKAMLYEGSDLAQGKLLLGHWALKLIALNFYDLLEAYEVANYLEVTLQPVKEKHKLLGPLTVLIQKKFGETPAERVSRLEKRIAELEAQRAS